MPKKEAVSFSHEELFGENQPAERSSFTHDELFPPEGGFKASVKQTIGSTIKGAGQLASDIAPSLISKDNAVSRYGQEVIDANPTAVHGFSDIADKPGTFVKEAVGNAGASIGGILAARALGTGITAAAPLAGPAAPIVAAVGQGISWLGPTAIAALPSYGGIREKQIVNDPLNDDSWKAKALAGLGAATVGFIEQKFGPQNWAQNLTSKAGQAKVAEMLASKTVAGSVGKGIVKGGLVEGSEELVQNPIEQLASFDDPTTKENLTDTAFAGVSGAVGGGVFGGAMGPMSRGLKPEAEQQPTDQNQQAIASTLPPAASGINIPANPTTGSDVFAPEPAPIISKNTVIDQNTGLIVPPTATVAPAPPAGTITNALAAGGISPTAEQPITQTPPGGSNSTELSSLTSTDQTYEYYVTQSNIIEGNQSLSTTQKKTLHDSLLKSVNEKEREINQRTSHPSTQTLAETHPEQADFDKGKTLSRTAYQEENGVGYSEYTNPETGLVDTFLAGFGDNDFVGYMRVYENGKPTNRFTSKLEVQSGKKGAAKEMLAKLGSMLPADHEYTENDTISTDGIRHFQNQLRNGYEIVRDKDGKTKTSKAFLSGASKTNDIGIGQAGDFTNLQVNNEQDFNKAHGVVAKLLAPFGINSNGIRRVGNQIEVDMPVLRRFQTPPENQTQISPVVLPDVASGSRPIVNPYRQSVRDKYPPEVVEELQAAAEVGNPITPGQATNNAYEKRKAIEENSYNTFFARTKQDMQDAEDTKQRGTQYEQLRAQNETQPKSAASNSEGSKGGKLERNWHELFRGDDKSIRDALINLPDISEALQDGNIHNFDGAIRALFSGTRKFEDYPVVGGKYTLDTYRSILENAQSKSFADGEHDSVNGFLRNAGAQELPEEEINRIMSASKSLRDKHDAAYQESQRKRKKDSQRGENENQQTITQKAEGPGVDTALPMEKAVSISPLDRQQRNSVDVADAEQRISAPGRPDVAGNSGIETPITKDTSIPGIAAEHGRFVAAQIRNAKAKGEFISIAEGYRRAGIEIPDKFKTAPAVDTKETQINQANIPESLTAALGEDAINSDNAPNPSTQPPLPGGSAANGTDVVNETRGGEPLQAGSEDETRVKADSTAVNIPAQPPTSTEGQANGQKETLLDQQETKGNGTPADVLRSTSQSETGAADDGGAGAKEPWQMTRDEWQQAIDDTKINFTGSGGPGKYGMGRSTKEGSFNTGVPERQRLRYGIKDNNIEGLQIPAQHYDVVTKAISEGKPVPAEVLADYPDLKANQTPRQTAEQITPPISKESTESRGAEQAKADKPVDKQGTIPSLTTPAAKIDNSIDNMGGGGGYTTGVNARVVEIVKPAEKVSEFPLTRVRDAYSNTSNSPGNAARIEEGWYQESLKTLRETLSREAAPGKQGLIDSTVNEFGKAYIARRESVWRARSVTVSSHIAGGSNFNSKQAGRRGNALDRAEESFSAWVDSEEKRIYEEMGITQSREEKRVRHAQAKEEARQVMKEREIKQKAANRKLPIVNFNDGDAIGMTKEEWSKTSTDYKLIQVSDDGTHRIRSAMVNGHSGLSRVYLTDAPVVKAPEVAKEKPAQTFSPATAIKLVADDINALRPQDVYRVLESVDGDNREMLRTYIIKNHSSNQRILDEVRNAMDELTREDETAKTPAWHTAIPTEGLPITDADKKPQGYRDVAFKIATDAYDAIRRDDLMAGTRMFSIFMPAKDGRNGIARFIPQDQDIPAGWQTLIGEMWNVGAKTKEQVVRELEKSLNRLPIIGSEEVVEPKTEEPGGIDFSKIKTRDSIKFKRGNREYTEMVLKVMPTGHHTLDKTFLVDLFGDKYIKYEEIIAVQHADGTVQKADEEQPATIADIEATKIDGEQAVFIEDPPKDETPKQEDKRLDKLDDVQEDILVSPDTKEFEKNLEIYPVQATKALKEGMAFVKKFVKAVPEFLKAPVFTVVNGPDSPTFEKIRVNDRVIGNEPIRQNYASGNLLRFTDSYQFDITPKMFGLRAESLKPGQKIRIDLDAWLGVKSKDTASYTGIGKLEGQFQQNGEFWTDGHFVAKGISPPAKNNDFMKLDEGTIANVVAGFKQIFSDTTKTTEIDDPAGYVTFDHDSQWPGVLIGGVELSRDLVDFIVKNTSAKGKTTFTVISPKDPVAINKDGVTVAILMPMAQEEEGKNEAPEGTETGVWFPKTTAKNPAISQPLFGDTKFSQSTAPLTPSSTADLTPRQRRAVRGLESNGKVKLLSAARAMQMLETLGAAGKAMAKYMVAWHGSPHDHDGFRSDKIGTGEGAQAYGYGLYFAGNKEVAEYYKDNVRLESASELAGIIKEYSPDAYGKLDKATRSNPFYGIGDSAIGSLIQKINSAGTHGALGEDWKSVYDAIKSMPGAGKLYQVDLAPSADEYLDWDKPLSEQSEKVKAAILNEGFNEYTSDDGSREGMELTGEDLYHILSEFGEDYGGLYGSSADAAKAASEYLHSLGIRGIRYLDGTSRSKGEGQFNYVIFDENDIQITAKYSKDGKIIEGFYLNGVAHLIPENIEKGQLWPAIRHEVAAHLSKMLETNAGFRALLESIDSRQNEQSATGEAIRKAMKKVPADTGLRDGETYKTLTPARKRQVDALRKEEVLAYLLTNAKGVGIVRQFIAMIKRMLIKMGMSHDMLTVDDLSAIAEMAIRREARGTIRDSRSVGIGEFSQSAMMSVKEAAKAIYSKLDQVASESFTGMKAQGVLNFLSKQGVKKAEIEAVGIDAWIAAKKPTDKVTREELSGFVRANMVEVEDVVLGNNSIFTPEHAAEYHELDRLSLIEEGLTDEQYLSGLGVLTEEQYQRRKELGKLLAKAREKDTHFDQYTEPNSDPGSYREMFVAAPNIVKQSDDIPGFNQWLKEQRWYEAWKSEGSDQQKARSLYDQWAEREKAGKSQLWRDGHTQFSDIANPIVRIRFNTETRDSKTFLRIEEMQGPSNANQQKMPKYLRENIYQLGVKRAIAYAKEQGLDGITFATKPGMTAGETQADRYDLSKVVDEIKYRHNSDDTYDFTAYKDGKIADNKNDIRQEGLAPLFGKEVARKIIAGEGEKRFTKGMTSLAGDNLKITNSGLVSLYDRQLPAMFEAYSKEKFTDGMLPITESTPGTFPLFSQNTGLPTTAKFKAWHGKSVVSRVVYHGSKTFGQSGDGSFTFRDGDISSSNTKSPGAGLGHFFAENKNDSLPYAGTSGEVFPAYLRIENPFETNASDLPNFATRGQAKRYQEKLKRMGFDGIYLADEGHYISFEPNQAKSADQNNGEYSRENDDVRYSVATKAYDATVAETLGTFTERIKKADMSVLEKILSTAEYIFKKSGATMRMFQAQLDRRDDKYQLEEKILTTFVPSLKKAQKENKVSYKEANDELLSVDRTGESYKTKRDNSYEVVDPSGAIVGYAETQIAGYQMIDKEWNLSGKKDLRKDYSMEKAERFHVLDKKNKTIATFTDEKQATDFAVEAEQKELTKRGFSEVAKSLIKEFRDMTNRAFDEMVADYRRIMDEAAEAGLDEPTVSYVDESRRFGLFKNGIRVAEFASKETAHRAGGRDHTVRRQADSDIKKEMKLSEVIAEMGDLRGSYFPRQRQNGGVILRAAKDGENSIMKKFDLYLTKDESIDGETGAINKRPMSSWLKERFNDATGHIPFVETLEKEARALRAKGYNVTVERDSSIPESVFDTAKLITSVNDLLSEAMKESKGKGGIGKDAAEQVNKILTANLSEIFKGRGYLSSRIARADNYVEGFETDMLIAGTQYARGLASGFAKRNAARRMVAAITGRDISYGDWQADNEGGQWDDYVKFVNERRLDPTQQPKLHGEAMSWMQEVLRNDEQIDRIMGTIKGLAVLKFMGFRVSSAAVNAINMIQAVPATISSQTGGSLTSALRSVTFAAVQYGKHRAGLEVSQEHREIFQEITNRGWDDAQFNMENASVLQSKLGQRWAAFNEYAMKMFGAVEKANRATTIFAAYQEARKNTGLSHEEAMMKAKHISDRSHGVYGKATMPVWTRGSANPMKLFYTFLKFSHNYTLNMTEMGLKGDHKAAAYMLLSPAILAGSGATLAAPVLFALAGALGIGGDDPEEEFYKWAEETFGTDRFARHGLAGLAGINLKGSIQMNNPMPTKISELFGAPGAIFTDTTKGIGLLGKGEYAKGAEALLPTAIGTMSKAVREATEGVSTGSYSPVFYGNEPIKADGIDATLRFIGFNPSAISGIREKQYNEKKVAEKYAERRNNINTMAKQFYIYGNGDQMGLMKEIQRYNELVAASGRRDIPRITSQSIAATIRRANRPGKTERLRER